MSLVELDDSKPPKGTLIDSMTDGVDEPPGADGAVHLGRGTAVDRYVVLHELGSGGMGVVYSAYDPELDRRVALKVLRANTRGSRGRNRLLREAKAIAKLNHPNVVTVHDVGTYEGRVFIAMEYVDGVTFRHWVQRERRSLPDVLAVLVKAGRGLAAAHAVDLVHRDFKPDNVLVEPSGRVVVLDFGLARRSGSSDGHSSDTQHISSDLGLPESSDELAMHLTRTGARLGTPAYMAPEQHLGQSTDARTDQFSFCVVLWEALFGARPFTGPSPRATAMRVVKGAIDEPPKGATAPTWVRKILTRGLSPRPRDRYPSMDALLRELRSAPGRRRRVILGSLGVVAAVGGLTAAAVWSSNQEDDRCSGGDARWDGVWDDARRARVQAAFEDTGTPFSTTAWQGVSTVLDAYSKRWAEVYRDACEATGVHAEQSRETQDLRMACLRERLASASSLIDEFASADANVVEHAVEAVRSLPRLDTCSNVEALMAVATPPADPKLADEVERNRALLGDAQAKESAARFESALELLEVVEPRARRINYPPLLAEVLLRRGAVLERQGDFEQAEKALLESIWTAKASRHQDVEAEAWVRLVWVTGVERFSPEQGHLWAKFADAAVTNLPDGEVLQANLAHNLGGVLYRERRLDAALTQYRQALREQRRLLGADDPRIAMTLNHIGNVLMEQNEFGPSQDYCERSLALRERVLGRRHPKVAASLNNLAELARKQGEPDRCLLLAERSLEIVRGLSVPEEEIALALAGWAHLQLEDSSAAARVFERLVDVRTTRADPQSPSTTDAWVSLGRARVAQGRREVAIELFERVARLERERRPVVAAEALLSVLELESEPGDEVDRLVARVRALEPAEPDEAWDERVRERLERAVRRTGLDAPAPTPD